MHIISTCYTVLISIVIKCIKYIIVSSFVTYNVTTHYAHIMYFIKMKDYYYSFVIYKLKLVAL